MADLIGQTLGNYRIESLLGAGGMGEVYRAVHVRLDRAVAIKVLHANQAADPTFQARFLREARAAAALSHPNIVEVFDFGEQDGASYLVMELIPDGSLRTLLRQRSTGQGWSLGLGVDLVRQAAEGLAYAHAHGMIHRDIKPDNLLLHRLDSLDPAERGSAAERYELKISDFGLARLLDDGGELTVTGMVMGTPTYMSPEQCQGGELDGRSDLYSLGVVLYEVATGAPPFRVKTLSEAVFKHISAPPIPPREIHPELPAALEDVILRCLEKRPEDRFATGTELAEALDGALGDTELRTIITTRDAAASATPTPAALADSTAPTIAESTPGRRTPSPRQSTIASSPRKPTNGPASRKPGFVSSSRNPARTAASAPPPRKPAVAATAQDAEDNATIRASRAVVPANRVTTARSSGTADASKKAPARWPQPDVAPQSANAAGGFKSLLAQPRVLGIGGGAALVVFGLIVALTFGAHSTANSKANRATPSTTVNTTPTASPTPIETVKFQDSLKTSSRKWQISSHTFYSNDGYEVTGAWTTYSPIGNLGNGTISVRMRQMSGANNQYYGILFRAPNDSSPTGYFFGITQNQQWSFAVLSNGNSTPIVAPTTDVHIKSGLNTSNTIAVRAIGNHFVFYINGAQVGEVDNNAFSSGRIGLINTDNSLFVVYNDFTVSVPAS